MGMDAMEHHQNNSYSNSVAALKYGVASILLGFAFCGLALIVRRDLFFLFAGIAVLLFCLTLVALGVRRLKMKALLKPTPWPQRWRTGIAFVVLILNFPLGFVCAAYTFKHMSFYTITIVNHSPQALESVSLRSALRRDTNDLTLIPPHHRFDRIEPGKHVQVSWDARDEEGVLLRATWRGRTIEQNVTGYTLWEMPNDFKVRIGQDGKISVKQKE